MHVLCRVHAFSQGQTSGILNGYLICDLLRPILLINWNCSNNSGVIVLGCDRDCSSTCLQVPFKTFLVMFLIQ
jgi:hypothetical protein